VLSIIAIVTTIALVGQSSFNRSVLLTDSAYAVALSLREMQSLGLSSRRYGGVQDAGYGAYFGTPPLASYTVYVDTMDADPANVASFPLCQVGASLPSGHPEKKPGDCIYTPGSDQAIQTYNLQRGFTISRFCGRDSGGTLRCSTDSTSPLTSLVVTFVRSTTDTAFLAQRAGSWISLSDARIYLKSADSNDERQLCLSQVGQISVSYADCP